MAGRKTGISNNLNILQWNCRSAGPTFQYLEHFLKDSKKHVLAIQSLNTQKQKLPKLDGYYYPPVTQVRGRAGKVMVATYVSTDITYRPVSTPAPTDNDDIHTVCVEVVVGGLAVCIVNAYYPRGVRPGEADWMGSLDPGRRWLLLGDFNAHSPLWTGDRRTLDPATINVHFTHTITEADLAVLNDGSITRVADRGDQRSSSIDLSLVSPELFPSCHWQTLHDPLGSDHLPIEITVGGCPERAEVGGGGVRYRLGLADWDRFRSILSADDTADAQHTATETQEGVELVYEKIRGAVLRAADQSIPKTSGGACPKAGDNPWWNASCEEAVKQKRAAFKAWMRSRTRADPVTIAELHTLYKQANIHCNKIVATAKKEYFTDFILEQINNPSDTGKLWKEIKKMKNKFHLPDTPLTHNNTRVTNIADKAEIFADTFATASQSQHLPTAERTRREQVEREGEEEVAADNTTPINQPLTLQELRSAVLGIKSVKVATGGDPISYALIKQFPDCFLKKLLNFYQLCWRVGTIPAEWKRATIVPIPKPGKPRANPSSYRPISLTPHLGKLYERILKPRLEHFCESRGVIPLAQAGFRKGRGVTDHTVRLAAHVKKALSRRHSTLATFYDIHRAYDTVWHHKLISKIKKIGISGNFLAFIESFLKSRSFRVKCRGVLSSSRHVDMGVPQGSVIAPLLFSIMLHDINNIDVGGAVLALYADDLAIWKTVSGNVNKRRTRERSVATFQAAVDRVVAYMRDSGFTLSPEKTVFIVFSNRYALGTGRNQLFIKINDVKIYPSKQVKFLGVIFQHQLRWTAHIKHITDKARKKLGLLRVLAVQPWANTGTHLRHIAQALVRSVLTYGQEVYHTAPRSLLAYLQNTDALAFKIALGLPGWSSQTKTYKEAGVLPILRYNKLATANYVIRAREVANSTTVETIEGTQPMSQVIKNQEPYQTINDYITPLLEQISLQTNNIARRPVPPVPPWLLEQPEIISNYGDITKKDSPHLIAAMAKELISTTFQSHLHVYTDGSVQEDGGVGAAFVVPDLKIERRYCLPKGNSIFTAELTAILMALTLFGDMPSPPLRIAILSDSKAALMAIGSGRGKERAEIKHEINHLAHQLITRGTAVSLVWVPGHTSLRGNDRADKCAKEAARGEGATPLNTKLSATEIRTTLVKVAWEEWQKTCVEEMTQKGWWELTPPVKKCVDPPGPISTRNLIHRLRVGAWLGRYVKPAPLCTCGQTLSLEHLVFHCTQNKLHFKPVTDILEQEKLPLTLSSLLIPRSGDGWSLAVNLAKLIKVHPLGRFF